MAQNLSKGISPSHTITVSNFNKIKTKQEKLDKLIQISKINLENTLEILKWNVENHIYLYRFSSKLIPLATWKGFEWNYCTMLKEEFEKVGEYIKKNHIRVSAHPDHYSVINTPHPQIFESTIKDLVYHDNFMQAMGLDEKYKLVVHVGGVYGNKEEGKRNFIKQFKLLPETVQKRIILENDDKSYQIQDVLEINKAIQVPIVLDVHHHMVNHEEEKIDLKRIFKTWEHEYFPPKIHISSPKSEQEKRAHADYINYDELKKFFQLASKLNQDFDIMIEAKAKDLAVLDLRSQIEDSLIKRK